MLQQIKSLLRDQLGLPPLAVLVVAGCLSHLVLNAALRKSPTSAWGLLAPGDDPVLAILFRHGLDVLKMLAAPLLIVALGIITTR